MLHIAVIYHYTVRFPTNISLNPEDPQYRAYCACDDICTMTYDITLTSNVTNKAPTAQDKVSLKTSPKFSSLTMTP